MKFKGHYQIGSWVRSFQDTDLKIVGKSGLQYRFQRKMITYNLEPTF